MVASRKLALLLTDLVDSTALNAAVGDTVMHGVWEQHDRVARDLIRKHGGTEIGRSDGFLVAFEDVENAVQFALDYHRALDGFEPQVRARVGIHFGDVELRQNTPEDTASGATVYDIDGMALPVAARVAAVAGPRQTLLSAVARSRLDPATSGVMSHGHWQLKGLSEPVELFELGDDRCEFLRPDDGDKAYQVAHVAGAWTPTREIRHTIPFADDAFVGRGADLRRLAQLVAARTRLISIVGIGGVGKTRITTHLARRWLGEFTGGAWFCDLSAARDLDGILSAVASGLDVSLGRAEPRKRLADVIAGRGRCLVILDNFEQVAFLAAETIGYWFERAPKATFIVTTRERLGLPSEHVLVLEPLELRDATSLFVRRSGAQHPGFDLGPGDTEAAEALVELLDRLPLAIELAVGRLNVMSVKTMLARISQRFSLLAARSGRSKRQSTLRAAFDWSWDLLTNGERSLLAQASVFAGGFTLEAAEAVLRIEEDIPVLDALHSLVDKSFVRTDGARFGMLVSVREYAAEKLASLVSASSAPEAQVEQRHGEHFAQPLQGDAKSRAAELENILAACRRAIQRGDHAVASRSATNAWTILEARGPYQVGIELIESALAMPELPAADRVRLTQIHGRFLLASGDAQQAREQLTQAYHGAVREGIRLDELRALSSLAELNLVEGHMDAAKAQHEQSVAMAEDLGHPPLLCSSLNGLGRYFNRVGQPERARASFERALAVARQSGQRRWEGGILSNLGNVFAILGDRAAARGHYDDAIAIANELGDRVWQADLLCNLGLLKLDEGDIESAREDFTTSLARARENSLSLVESVVLCNIGLLHEATGQTADAETAYRQALEVARRRGDRRSEGQFLGYLGLLVAKRNAVAEARSSLVESITILRSVQDRISLAIVLCRYAEAASAWGERASAAASLAEASTIAAEMKAADGSELAASLARARRALEDVKAG